jgi:hypothetical protein
MQFVRATPLLFALSILGCGSDDDRGTKAPVGAPAATEAGPAKKPATRESGLTEPMAAEFGAACMVP